MGFDLINDVINNRKFRISDSSEAAGGSLGQGHRSKDEYVAASSSSSATQDAADGPPASKKQRREADIISISKLLESLPRDPPAANYHCESESSSTRPLANSIETMIGVADPCQLHATQTALSVNDQPTSVGPQRDPPTSHTPSSRQAEADTDDSATEDDEIEEQTNDDHRHAGKRKIAPGSMRYPPLGATMLDQATRVTSREKPNLPRHNGCNPPQLDELELGHANGLELNVPGLLACHLLEHQKEGIRFMFERYKEKKAALLCHDMGLGKTVQVIAFIAALFGKTNREDHDNSMNRRFVDRSSFQSPLAPKVFVTGPQPKRLAAPESKPPCQLELLLGELAESQRSQSSMTSSGLVDDIDSSSPVLRHGRESEQLVAPVPQPSTSWNTGSPRKNHKVPLVVLVICRSSLIGNWKNEFEKWGWFRVKHLGTKKDMEEVADSMLSKRQEFITSAAAEVVIVSKELLRKAFDNSGMLKNVWFEAVVVDELHEFKQKKNQAGEALQGKLVIGKNCAFKIGLTGTPIENKIEDIFQLCQVLQTGMLGDMVESDFKKAIVNPINEMLKKNPSHVVLERGKRCQVRLSKWLGSAMHRRKKGIDMMGGKKKELTLVMCKMPESQRCLYDGIFDSLDARLIKDHSNDDMSSTRRSANNRPVSAVVSSNDRGLLFNSVKDHRSHGKVCERCPYCLGFPLIKKLAHAATSPLLLKEDESYILKLVEWFKKESKRGAVEKARFERLAEAAEEVKKCDGMGPCSSKLNGLKHIVELESERCARVKVLVFCEHRAQNVATMEWCKRNHYRSLLLDGDVAMEDRHEMIEEFNREQRSIIFVLSPRVAGHGINLTSAEVVVIMHPSWNPALETQSEDRAYRIGQKNDVKVYRLVSIGTVDEMMISRQAYKTVQADVSLDGDAIVDEDATNFDKDHIEGYANLLRRPTKDDRQRLSEVGKNYHSYNVIWLDDSGKKVKDGPCIDEPSLFSIGSPQATTKHLTTLSKKEVKTTGCLPVYAGTSCSRNTLPSSHNTIQETVGTVTAAEASSTSTAAMGSERSNGVYATDEESLDERARAALEERAVKRDLFLRLTVPGVNNSVLRAQVAKHGLDWGEKTRRLELCKGRLIELAGGRAQAQQQAAFFLNLQEGDREAFLRRVNGVDFRSDRRVENHEYSASSSIAGGASSSAREIAPAKLIRQRNCLTREETIADVDLSKGRSFNDSDGGSNPILKVRGLTMAHLDEATDGPYRVDPPKNPPTARKTDSGKAMLEWKVPSSRGDMQYRVECEVPLRIRGQLDDGPLTDFAVRCSCPKKLKPGKKLCKHLRACLGMLVSHSSSEGDILPVSLDPTDPVPEQRRRAGDGTAECDRPELGKWVKRGRSLLTLVAKRDDTSGSIPTSIPIAAFDLDGTLIRQKNEQSWGKDRYDPEGWKFTYDDVPTKLKELSKKGKRVVIFTNQVPLSQGEHVERNVNAFKDKVKRVVSELGIPVDVYVATGRDNYRKPKTGMWERMASDLADTYRVYGINVQPNLEESLYVGDAAGREQDPSWADAFLAFNIGLKFFTAEEFFKPSCTMEQSKPPLPSHPAEGVAHAPVQVSPSRKKEILLLVGSPACGKSHFAIKHCRLYGNYERICQDEWGCKRKCLEKAKEVLDGGRSVVIDATNRDAKTREDWVNLATGCSCIVRACVFDRDKAFCLHLNEFRSLTSERKLLPSNVIRKYFKEYVKIDQETEGISEGLISPIPVFGFL